MACGFGLIEALVGKGDEGFGALGFGGALGDAVGERRTAAFCDFGCSDAFEERRNGVRIGTRQDQCELVATDARRVVAVPKDATEPLTERTDGGVARLVSVLVVDQLEVVEIDEDQGERPAVSHAARDRHVEEAVEGATVEEAGQGVMPGVVPQDLHPQRDHAEAGDQGGVDAVRVQRRVRVEPRRGVQQGLAAGIVERFTSGAKDLPAEPRLVDDHGRVVEIVLGHQCIEGVIDDREATLTRRQFAHHLGPEIAHGFAAGNRSEEMSGRVRLRIGGQQGSQAAPESTLSCHESSPCRPGDTTLRRPSDCACRTLLSRVRQVVQIIGHARRSHDRNGCEDTDRDVAGFGTGWKGVVCDAA